MFKNLKIAVKLLLFGISILTIPLITVGMTSISISGKALTKSTDEQLLTRANELALSIDDVFNREINTAKSWALFNTTIEALDNSKQVESSENNEKVKSLNNTFASIKKKEGLGENYQVILATDTSGSVIAASEEKYLGVTLKDRGYIQEALKGNENLDEVALNKVTGEPFIPIGIPIYSGNGNVTGVMAVVLDIAFINDIVDDTKIGENGYPYIIDSTGLVLAHPNQDHILKTNLTQTPGLEQVVANMIAGKRGVDKYVLRVYQKAAVMPLLRGPDGV